MQQFLERFTRNYGIQVSLYIENPWVKNIDPYQGMQLFRIIQEALSNIRKHADCSSGAVSFLGNAQELLLVIEDNGRGFNSDKPEPAKESSFGLEIMKERVQKINGLIKVCSKPEGGTKVIVQIPIEQKGEGEQVEGIACG